MVRATGDRPLPSGVRNHAHAHPSRQGDLSNTIYVGRAHSTFDGKLPGAGVFRYDDGVVLSRPGESRSRWVLPDVLRDVPITYHKPSSWHRDYLQSAARGQEFVVQANEAVWAWALALITRHAVAP